MTTVDCDVEHGVRIKITCPYCQAIRFTVHFDVRGGLVDCHKCGECFRYKVITPTKADVSA